MKDAPAFQDISGAALTISEARTYESEDELGFL